MSKKSSSTSSQQVLVTDPIYKTSCITLDYDKTVELLCAEMHKLFDYVPGTTKLKGNNEIDAASFKNAKPALDQFHKSLKVFEEATDKKKSPFSLVMFSLKLVLRESRKDDSMWSGNKLRDLVENFINNNDAHMIFHAMEHYDRTLKRERQEVKRLTQLLEASEKSRERTIQEKKGVEASFIKLQNLTLDESQLDIEKGTPGHELMKLKALVSKFRLVAITRLQIAQTDIDSVQVIGFLSDLQFRLLKDIRHSRDASLFLGDVLSNLTYGLQLLINEASDTDDARKEQNEVINGLYQELVNLENSVSIQHLFDQAITKTEDEELRAKIKSILGKWNDCIVGVAKFSPKEIHLLCTTIDQANNAALLDAKVDNKPKVLKFEKFEDVSAGDCLTTLYKAAINIKQIYSDHTFFDIEGKDELRGLRNYCVEYFEQFRAFMQSSSDLIRKTKDKVELASLEGYKPEYEEQYKDIYDHLWVEKKGRALNRSVVDSSAKSDKLAIRDTTVTASLLGHKKKVPGTATARKKTRPVTELASTTKENVTMLKGVETSTKQETQQPIQLNM